MSGERPRGAQVRGRGVSGGGHTRERGATGLEYAGLLAAVVLVVGAVVLGIVQGDLARHTTNAVCRVFLGEGCEDTAEAVQSALEKALSGDYVALGDSFASGQGAGYYHDGTTTTVTTGTPATGATTRTTGAGARRRPTPSRQDVALVADGEFLVGVVSYVAGGRRTPRRSARWLRRFPTATDRATFPSAS
jgi:hypothetical protein